MRVLIVYAQPVFWSMGEGCGAAAFTRFPAALAARGHEVRVCLPDLLGRPEGSGNSGVSGIYETTGASGVPNRPSQVPPAEEYSGFLLHRFPATRSFVPDSNLPAVRRLWARWRCWTRFIRWGGHAGTLLSRAFPPDLVIGMGHYEAPVAWRLARRIDRPNVTRLFGNSLALALRSLPRFYANFPEVVALKTRSDLIILSDDGADGDAVVRRLRVSPRRLAHLRNGIDFDAFQPGPPSEAVRRRLGIQPGQVLLLTATRLASEKKLERAIFALSRLVELGVDAQLALLGDGPQKERLRAEARAQGVADRVLFPGPILHREMPDWYRTADVVLSLLDRTNASNPVFEAMACGRVVVALDAGTTRSVVRHGETGLVLRLDELPDIGRFLSDLLKDAESMRKMEEGAVRTIPTLVMGLEDRLRREVELIEGVVEDHQGRRKRRRR